MPLGQEQGLRLPLPLFQAHPEPEKGIEVGKAQELSPDPAASAVATSPTSRHVIKTFLFCSFVLFEFLSHATTGVLTNTSFY